MTNDTTDLRQIEIHYYITIQLAGSHSLAVCDTTDREQHDKDLAQLDADLKKEPPFVMAGTERIRSSYIIRYAPGEYEWVTNND